MRIDIRLTETNNDAFQDDNGKAEFERIVHTIADKLIQNVNNAYFGIDDNSVSDFALHDSNGNRVGIVYID